MPAAQPIDTGPLRSRFAELFGAGGRVRVIRAPGRVNLIGEHTDYNDGFVFPMAIEPHVLIACRGRDDGLIRIASTAFTGPLVEFSLTGKIERGEPAWSNYPRGMAAELLAAGIPLVGFDALIDNSLPVGGGLSSSAALEIGTGLAMLTLAGLTMDPARLALIAQRAEHEFARVPCGIMDQTIVVSARAGTAMLLDCRTMTRQFIPINSAELRVVIVNSMVKHELTGGEYAERRRQCEKGVEHFRKQNPDVKALRDVTLKQLEAANTKLPETVFRRCRHVITENGRAQEFAAQLNKRNYDLAGAAMVQSHASLRDDYEVSCPELDFLTDMAMSVKGAYGARLTGGGFGGCIVALVQPRAVDAFRDAIGSSYRSKFRLEPAVYVTLPGAGAAVIA